MELPLSAALRKVSARSPQERAEMKRRVEKLQAYGTQTVLHVFRPICIHPEIPRVSPRFPRSVDTAHAVRSSLI